METVVCFILCVNNNKMFCTDRCFKIPQLPSYCTLIQDPQNQCCQLPYCQAPTPSPNKQLTPRPGLNPSVGPTLKPNPLNTPTPGPGQTTLAPRPKGMLKVVIVTCSSSFMSCIVYAVVNNL